MAKAKTLINVSAGPGGAVYKLTATAAKQLDAAREVLKAIHPVLPAALGPKASDLSSGLGYMLAALGPEPEKAVAGSTEGKTKSA